MYTPTCMFMCYHGHFFLFNVLASKYSFSGFTIGVQQLHPAFIQRPFG